MELGDQPTKQRAQRTPVEAALDTFERALAELITVVETGASDHQEAEEKVVVWQRFESIRNKLPLIDHALITAAEAADLAREYCSSTMTHFLVRVLQLSHGEAASKVRAANALGPRMSMLGEKLEPQLPRLAALQRNGAVTPEKVAILERAMHNSPARASTQMMWRRPSSCSPNMHRSSVRPI